MSKCKNCGADESLHHFETDQCPHDGIEEQGLDKPQQWDTATFEYIPEPKVIQPSEIEEHLKKNYSHRAEVDENQVRTGHFALSPKEILDMIIDLTQ